MDLNSFIYCRLSRENVKVNLSRVKIHRRKNKRKSQKRKRRKRKQSWMTMRSKYVNFLSSFLSNLIMNSSMIGIKGVPGKLGEPKALHSLRPIVNVVLSTCQDTCIYFCFRLFLTFSQRAKKRKRRRRRRKTKNKKNQATLIRSYFTFYYSFITVFLHSFIFLTKV